MNPPAAAEVETKPAKTEQSKSYECGLCDTEVVYKIAQELLPGLASACIDNTTGGIFTSAGTVAVDMRKEMTDYLTKRSETYVAEYLLSENSSTLELSEDPYDIILNLVDDFASSKTNMLSRVSEWVSSDRREDRIDDFVQQMEINGFWLLARRESVASLLVKNVDYKNSFHCVTVCSSEEELVKHRSECMFRPMDCTNEGCTTRYCAAQKEHHETVCPFMVLPCEQKCSDFVMRREMDRHCVTICPMKLVNCAFYTVGCAANIPRCNVQQHNLEELSTHLLYIIRTAHKEASDDDLKQRVEQIRNQLNIERLARARDTRALTYLIKDTEAKLGPLDVKTKPHEDSNKKESPTKTEPTVVKDGSDPPKQSAVEMSSATEKPVTTQDDNTKLPNKREPSVVNDGVDPPKKNEEHKGSQSTEKPVITEDDNTKLPNKSEPTVVKDGVDPPKKNEEQKGSQSTEKPVITEDDSTKLGNKSEPSVVKDGVDPPKKNEELKGSQSTEKPVITEDDSTKLANKSEPLIVKDGVDPLKKNEELKESQSTEKPVVTEDDNTKLSNKSEPLVVKDGVDPPKKHEEHKGSQSTEKPVVTEDDNTKLSNKTEPSIVKDAVDPPKKTEDHKESHSTEKPVITEDDSTKLPAKEVLPELSTSFDPPVKIEGHNDEDEDDDESFASPVTEEHEQSKETVKDSTISDKEESTDKSTVNDEREKTHDASDSDEEFMDSSLEPNHDR